MASNLNFQDSTNSYVFDEGVEEFAFAEEGNAAEQEAELYAMAESDFVEFDDVHFGFDTNKLTDKERKVLAQNTAKAKEAVDQGKKIEVKAYCCEIGAGDYNMALSQRRASAIEKEMVAQGIPKDKIRALGCGQEHQVAWTDAKDRLTRIRELSPNRRAEMVAVPSAA